MTDGPPASLIARYYLYAATSSLGFLIPIWVLVLESRGLTFTQIALLDSVFFGTIVLAELPTGYTGDRIGRRNALVVSSVLVSVAAVAFGFATSFPAFLAVFFLWALSQTFRSGSDGAWLYDALLAHGQPESFARIRGRGQAVWLGVSAVGAVTSGFLFELDPLYPFVATAALNLLSAGVVATFPEARGGEERFSVAEVRGVFSRLASPSIRGFVLWAALLYGVGWSADLFLQPTATRAGLDARSLGFVYAGLTAVAAVASNYAGALADRFGTRRLLHAAPLVLGPVLFAMALSPLLVVPVFLVVRAGLSLSMPVAEGYLNDRTPSLGRATTLSGLSMAISLVAIPVKLGSGPLADRVGPALTIAALGGVLLVGGVAVLGLGPPIPRPAVADGRGRTGETRDG